MKRRGEYLYNLWTDAEHPRGLWRRTTLEQYRTDTPDWDVLLDVDALAAAEDENWVWPASTSSNRSTPARWSAYRAVAPTLRSCANSTWLRVNSSPDGFTLPEGRHNVAWEDENTVLVGADFGDGSLTNVGLPRLVKRWRRGEPLQRAETIFAGEQYRRDGGCGGRPDTGIRTHGPAADDRSAQPGVV